MHEMDEVDVNDDDDEHACEKMKYVRMKMNNVFDDVNDDDMMLVTVLFFFFFTGFTFTGSPILDVAIGTRAFLRHTVVSFLSSLEMLSDGAGALGGTFAARHFRALRTYHHVVVHGRNVHFSVIGWASTSFRETLEDVFARFILSLVLSFCGDDVALFVFPLGADAALGRPFAAEANVEVVQPFLFILVGIAPAPDANLDQEGQSQ